LGVLAGGLLLGQPGASIAGGIAQESIANYLGSYSQEQEFEADMLGVRYMKRATYDPRAAASFLASLDAQTRLEAQLAGQDPNALDQVSMKATHPRTLDRVQRAINEAGGTQPGAMLERDIYLSKIDGLMFGDDPAQGVVVGGKFVHPPLRFAFEVPSAYKLVNLPDVVAIKGPKGTLGNFTLANPQPTGSLTAALHSYDPKGNITFRNIETLTINGMEDATAITRVNTKSGAADYRAVLVRHPGGKVYEFVFLSVADLGGRYDGDFQKIALSFRNINANEAAQYSKPRRIRVVTVQPGDTVQSLSSRMAVSREKEAWFRVLNGLTNGQGLQAGQKVKLVLQDGTPVS
jgi:predicted Zn-dependent protease